MKNIVDRLQDHLKKEKISVVKMAQQTRIPQDRVYAWLRGKGKPKAEDQKLLEEWMRIGSFMPELPTEKPAPMVQESAPEYSANSDIQAKYIALLERQESRYMEIGEAAAAKAIKALADTYATKDDLEDMRANLGLLQRSMTESLLLIRSLEHYAVFHGGGGKSPEKIAETLRGIRETLKNGKLSGKTKTAGN